MRIIILALLPVLLPVSGSAQNPTSPTRVVILGVGHSTQLVSEEQSPAALRAFFDRVSPDVMAVERPPNELARDDHYEFTYEIQYVALPYARELGIPVHGIDWIPAKDDMMLTFGVDLDEPPFVRTGWRGFLSFPDSATLNEPLLFADADSDRAARRAPWQNEWQPASRDFARRLFLYRTFLQARRIAAVAALYPGKTVLVQVGANHKDDIERVLADEPAIEVVQPSSYGAPTAAETQAAMVPEDLYAIATFNLLGVQSHEGVVDWPRMRSIIGELEQLSRTPEVDLLSTRLAALTGSIPADEAVERYGAISEAAGCCVGFTWNGVKDTTRLDSYFDPFGNLSVGQRATLEMAREYHRLGRQEEAKAARDSLVATLSPLQAGQLEAYWPEYLASGGWAGGVNDE